MLGDITDVDMAAAVSKLTQAQTAVLRRRGQAAQPLRAQLAP